MPILRLLLPVFAFAMLSGNGCFGQDNDLGLRNINIVAADSVIRTTACYESKKQKPLPDYIYYWCDAGKINHNLGGFTGKLLHGKYEVLDNQQKLRVKGRFNYGIMTGEWIRWYPNGNIQTTSSYKNGTLQGKVKIYSPDGKPCSILNYKQGLLQGKSWYFQKDTTIEKKYRSGKEIVKNDPSKKKVCFLKRKKNKKAEQKIKPDSSPQNTPANEEKKKKNWWQFSFLKRKQNAEDAKK